MFVRFPSFEFTYVFDLIEERQLLKKAIRDLEEAEFLVRHPLLGRLDVVLLLIKILLTGVLVQMPIVTHLIVTPRS